ncbi:nuclear GTPase SLIP-GC [Echria macrotheca]|uniref:Nuclear GTPase SLIP-GC n=1 Tax=Echria macrotheca TaxID=438768 RepID=A0AAJ0B472_9PEZI|nr:nuclear GTPase SLIP-GC [Echria macrotheca]
MSPESNDSVFISTSATSSRGSTARWTPDSTPRASAGRESSSSDSDSTSLPILTPSSSSVVSFSPHTSGVFRFRGSPGADAVRSSVEHDTVSPRRLGSPGPVGGSASPSPSNMVTPSITLSTPPPNARVSDLGQTHLDLDDVNTAINRIRLSTETPLDMSGMAAALPGTTPARQNPETSSSNVPNSQDRDLGRPVNRSRRSSSRTNLLPHDVRNEEPPSDRFHSPAFQQAFRDAKALMGSLAEVLSSSTIQLEPDSTLHELSRTAQKLANFQCPPTRIVGLVGDSAVGKSSLLNSLLDEDNLARTVSNEQLCTLVVTEYRYHELGTFAIEVEEYTQTELRELFTDMVANYRHNHFHSAEIEGDERGHWAGLANLALDTFSAMFRGRFTPDFLISGGQQEVVETLMEWSSGRRSAAGLHVFERQEDCAEELMRLTSEEASPRRPAIWPYIKKINVSLNAYILSRGLVLVDLPGLRDLNSARQVITERYLRCCHEIFAVCHSERAASNESVMAVFKLARQAGLSKIGIICTKSDLFTAREAIRDWPDERGHRVQDLIEHKKTEERILADIEEELHNLLDGEKEEKDRLYRDAGRQSITVKNLEQALARYVIEERNRVVTAELMAKYGPEVPTGNVSVFCSSNKLYWDHRNKTPVDGHLPFLHLSGIISIRKHCLSLVSESQLSIALSYIHNEVPNLVSRLDLWVQSGAGDASTERKEAVRAALDQLERQMREKLRARVSPVYLIGGLLRADFDENIYQRRDTRRWTNGALNAGSEWGSWHHSSYAAFVRNYGIYTTDVMGYRNWNEEGTETMVEDLSQPWDTFRSVLRDRADNLVAYLNQALIEAAESQDNLPEEFMDSAEPLYDALASCQRLLAAEVEDLCSAFESQVSQLRTSALSGLRTGFFGQSMETTYAAASQVYGTGSWARKKSIINSKLADEDQFIALIRRFRQEFRNLADQLQTDIRQRVRERLDFVSGIMDIIRSENVAEESEQDPEFRERVAVEVRRVKLAMEEVRLVCAR